MENISLTGGSYGGFMTNWIVTQTDMFRAAISERSISNLLSMVGTSDIGFWFNPLELNIDRPYSFDGMRKLMELSPIMAADMRFVMPLRRNSDLADHVPEEIILSRQIGSGIPQEICQ